MIDKKEDRKFRISSERKALLKRVRSAVIAALGGRCVKCGFATGLRGKRNVSNTYIRKGYKMNYRKKLYRGECIQPVYTTYPVPLPPQPHIPHNTHISFLFLTALHVATYMLLVVSR